MFIVFFYVQLERAENAHFLFVCGEDDQSVSPDCSRLLMDRLRQHGKTNYELLLYPGTGHLIEPPYSPHCYASFLKAAGEWPFDDTDLE